MIDHGIKPWDPAEALDTKEVQLSYLTIVAEEGDEAALAEAHLVVARARELAQLAS